MRKVTVLLTLLLLFELGAMAQGVPITMNRTYTHCSNQGGIPPSPAVLVGGYSYPGCNATVYTYYYGHLNTNPSQQYWACPDPATLEHTIRTKFCTCWDDTTNTSTMPGIKNGATCEGNGSSTHTVSDCDY